MEPRRYIVTKMIRFGAIALMFVMTTAVGAQDNPGPVAQEKPATSTVSPKPPAAAQPEKPAPPRPPQVPLKIQLVLSRYQGEKKLSSVPYLLWVTSNDQRTSLRMGVKIPVYSGGGAAG